MAIKPKMSNHIDLDWCHWLLYLSQLMDVVEPETEYLPICVTAARIIKNATY